MITDFYVLSAETVPSNYIWDLGTPLDLAPTNTLAYIGTSYVSGYAPALRVVFGNNSISDTEYNFINYTWNFGDYYHDSNNSVSLSCASIIQHTYIMPGLYTVTLTHQQAKGRAELDQTGNSGICRGKYDRRWFWDELNCLTPQGASNILATTWSQVSCGAELEKWWSDENICFQKYCKLWSWFDLTSANNINPVRWYETNTDAIYEKKWMFESNDTICTQQNASFLDTTGSVIQTVIKTQLVEVKELYPEASMLSVSGVFGVSPHTVQLSPRNCKPGSFPIDRIDWDFGDGSPIKTITRYTPPINDSEVINTGFFASDLDDVRNYDVIHTYIRNKNFYPVFYPSLTCYSACTNSYDACSLTVGPISFSSAIDETHLLKTRNTLKGNIYAFSINNTISIATSNNLNKTIIPQFTTPPNKLRNGEGISQDYFGYNGESYPQIYKPSCTFTIAELPSRFLATEDSTPLNTFDSLGDNGIPIKTEGDFFIFP